MSVEEAVIRWDALTDKELGSVVVYAPDLATLIADWRKRGEALEPFANEADCYGEDWLDATVAKDFRHISIGNLRRARAILKDNSNAVCEAENTRLREALEVVREIAKRAHRQCGDAEWADVLAALQEEQEQA